MSCSGPLTIDTDRNSTTRTTTVRSPQSRKGQITIDEISLEVSQDDPRSLLARQRVLDAAITLVRTGGLHAVTVVAVVGASRVARSTIYRHFGNIQGVQAAALEQVLSAPAPPVLAAGSLRDRLIDLVDHHAVVIDTAPLHLAAMAWVATNRDRHEVGPLRLGLIEQYRRLLADLLGSGEAREVLGECDVDSALAQLFGPIVFAKLLGLDATRHDACVRIVDDFLTARSGEPAVRDRRRKLSTKSDG